MIFKNILKGQNLKKKNEEMKSFCLKIMVLLKFIKLRLNFLKFLARNGRSFIMFHQRIYVMEYITIFRIVANGLTN